ncbi:MAG: SpoIID/LytB domain-containing protein [Muribaculaceae bacterium]|nr:SpoIID/LytB domain-containing protein [Muribaculaceae bacterium]
MTQEPEIRVGLITDGKPQITTADGGHLIGNLLIGYGFHWQESVSVVVGGELEPLPTPQGKIHIINRLPLEQYLESVTGSEMNPSAPQEFMKAHAVISRSWALRKIKGNGGELPSESNKNFCEVTEWEESDSHTGFDVCSDDHCQRYQGRHSAGVSVAAEAVRLTRGLILVDSEGDTADTRFSKCCGGMTERFSACWSERDFGYLSCRPDPWCGLPDMEERERSGFLGTILKDFDRKTVDFREWTAFVGKEEIRTRMKQRYGVDIGDITGLRPIDHGDSGRITRLAVEGTEGTFTVGKTLAIRRLLAADCLKSSWFEVHPAADGFRLEGHGWGHGVGLCQIGAAYMAFKGKSFREILDFYYPGTRLMKLYE